MNDRGTTLYIRIPANLHQLVKERAWEARQSAAKLVAAVLTQAFAKALAPKRKPRKRLVAGKRVRK